MRCMTAAELAEAINREHDDPPWEIDPREQGERDTMEALAMMDEDAARLASLEAELHLARATVLVMATRIKQLADEREYLVAALREACPTATVVAIPVAHAPAPPSRKTPRVIPLQALRAPKRHGWVSMR
jgi:hypothetical protein